MAADDEDDDFDSRATINLGAEPAPQNPHRAATVVDPERAMKVAELRILAQQARAAQAAQAPSTPAQSSTWKLWLALCVALAVLIGATAALLTGW